MDLRYCGRERLAELFLDRYTGCSGDPKIGQLADFYQCYRALVRLLVEALFIADPAIGALRKKKAGRAARRYLALADELARRL
jgi:aminoglycoside phosphotransferase family enzyme